MKKLSLIVLSLLFLSCLWINAQELNVNTDTSGLIPFSPYYTDDSNFSSMHNTTSKSVLFLQIPITFQYGSETLSDIKDRATGFLIRTCPHKLEKGYVCMLTAGHNFYNTVINPRPKAGDERILDIGYGVIFNKQRTAGNEYTVGGKAITNVKIAAIKDGGSHLPPVTKDEDYALVKIPTYQIPEGRSVIMHGYDMFITDLSNYESIYNNNRHVEGEGRIQKTPYSITHSQGHPQLFGYVDPEKDISIVESQFNQWDIKYLYPTSSVTKGASGSPLVLPKTPFLNNRSPQPAVGIFVAAIDNGDNSSVIYTKISALRDHIIKHCLCKEEKNDTIFQKQAKEIIFDRTRQPNRLLNRVLSMFRHQQKVTWQFVPGDWEGKEYEVANYGEKEEKVRMELKKSLKNVLDADIKTKSNADYIRLIKKARNDLIRFSEILNDVDVLSASIVEINKPNTIWETIKSIKEVPAGIVKALKAIKPVAHYLWRHIDGKYVTKIAKFNDELKRKKRETVITDPDERDEKVLRSAMQFIVKDMSAAQVRSLLAYAIEFLSNFEDIDEYLKANSVRVNREADLGNPPKKFAVSIIQDLVAATDYIIKVVNNSSDITFFKTHESNFSDVVYIHNTYANQPEEADIYASVSYYRELGAASAEVHTFLVTMLNTASGLTKVNRDKLLAYKNKLENDVDTILQHFSLEITGIGFYKIMNHDSEKYMDNGHLFGNGSFITQYESSGKLWQYWVVLPGTEKDGMKQYKIMNVSSGKFLDNGNQPQNGAKMTQYVFTGYKAQNWKFHYVDVSPQSNVIYKLESSFSGKVLENSKSYDNMTKIIQWKEHDGKWQEWVFERAPSDVPKLSPGTYKIKVGFGDLRLNINSSLVMKNKDNSRLENNVHLFEMDEKQNWKIEYDPEDDSYYIRQGNLYLRAISETHTLGLVNAETPPKDETYKWYVIPTRNNKYCVVNKKKGRFIRAFQEYIALSEGFEAYFEATLVEFVDVDKFSVPSSIDMGIYKIQNLDSEKYLDNGHLHEEGSYIFQYKHTDNNWQNWVILPRPKKDGEKNRYRIMNANNGKFLDNDNQADNGSKMLQYNFAGVDHSPQLWEVQPIIKYENEEIIAPIESVNSGKVLENSKSYENSTRIIQWKEHGGKFQKWVLKKLPSDVPELSSAGRYKIRIGFGAKNLESPIAPVVMTNNNWSIRSTNSFEIVQNDPQQTWEITPNSDGTYYISQNDVYLHASTGVNDYYYASLRPSPKKEALTQDRYKWYIIPAEDNKYYIINKKYGRFLRAYTVQNKVAYIDTSSGLSDDSKSCLVEFNVVAAADPRSQRIRREIKASDYFDFKDNLFIPQLLTPNGDGRNDTWKIPGLLQYKNYKVIIMNQLGEPVFTKVNYGHDGKWWSPNNKDVPTTKGTPYFYIIIFDGDMKNSLTGYFYVF